MLVRPVRAAVAAVFKLTDRSTMFTSHIMQMSRKHVKVFCKTNYADATPPPEVNCEFLHRAVITALVSSLLSPSRKERERERKRVKEREGGKKGRTGKDREDRNLLKFWTVKNAEHESSFLKNKFEPTTLCY